MAGDIIRPSALPDRASPVGTEKVPVDNGSTVGGATIQALVNAGRPLASQVEAEGGTEATKAMTPLTTKQAIIAQGDARFASAAQGARADSAVQPGDLATVATTGAYADLSGKPTLGTAAAQNSSAFATAAQGAKADTALQSVVEGANVSIDFTDPLRPVINVTGGAKGDDGDGFLRGFTYANNLADPQHSIDVMPGSARDVDNLATITLNSTVTKKLNQPWGPGNGSGGLDTGTISGPVWLHIHAILNPTTGAVDVLASTSMTSPVMPAGFTRRRWIGAVFYRMADGATPPLRIEPFINDGDWTRFKTPIQGGTIDQSTTPALQSIFSPPAAKSEVAATLIGYAASESAGAVVIRDPDLGSYTTSSSLASWYYPTMAGFVAQARLFSDNLGRVYTSDTNVSGAGKLVLRSEGWRIDRTVYR